MWTIEQRKKYMSNWRIKNANKVKNQSSSWRETNKDYDKKRKQKWYSENKMVLIKKHKEWRRNNKSKIITRHLQKTYGINLDQYNELLKKQNGCCAICQRPSKELKKRLGIDHDHTTGKIRGLLCYECNYGLGYFKDNSSFLLRAIDYLD